MFLRQSHAPVEGMVEAKDNDPLTGPKWGRSPALTIILSSVGGWLLGMRNMMVATLSEDYVVAAEAKGLSSRRVMIGYAARNAVLPSMSGFAISLGFVVSGAIAMEYVFSYPGIGYKLVVAVGGASSGKGSKMGDGAMCAFSRMGRA